MTLPLDGYGFTYTSTGGGGGGSGSGSGGAGGGAGDFQSVAAVAASIGAQDQPAVDRDDPSLQEAMQGAVVGAARAFASAAAANTGLPFSVSTEGGRVSVVCQDPKAMEMEYGTSGSPSEPWLLKSIRG